MTSRATIPYAPQDVQEVASLVRNLETDSKKGKQRNSHGKKSVSVKKTTFDIPGPGNGTVNSWRYQDWDYKRDDLPTYARGLFTYKRTDSTPAIAVRGYDKFFNVDEVNDTKWRNVEANTRGPYELSVKENGCIIFISGLENDVLLVCSKHSTGARQDSDLSHAIAGEKWVDKHLATVGKSREQLAKELRKRNVTAVAELCDDSFEEHVLAYDERSAGLYLHGINLNLPEFMTYSGPQVHEFADEWGFKKAQFVMRDDIESVKTFLESCAETGSWNGRDTEGFVIRCQKKDSSGRPYVDWFFKYKFEEPYLMYRQWRECTKAVIAGKAPKFKKHQKITEEYLLYAKRQLAKTPGLGKAFNLNHGIIAMRDGFLQERGLKGSDIIRQEYATDGRSSNDITHNVILVPLATIGCGKTTVAVALTKLFDWGHIQNDNITGKQNRPRQFVTQICNALAEHPAMIADRNNHQKRERKQLIEDVQNVVPEAHFVALHYVHDPKPEMIPKIRKITQQRVLDRGDNHQTIQAGSKSQQEIISIMEGFLARFEPLDMNSKPDSGFDEVIALDVAASSRENLETVVNHLHSTYRKLVPDLPSSSDLDEAIATALNDYQPDIKHDLSFKSKNKNQPPSRSTPNGNASTSSSKAPKLEYFCVRLPTPQILSLLSSTFPANDPQTSRFYHQLLNSRRIQSSFHVTLMHRASKPSDPSFWSHLESLHLTSSSSSSQQPPSAQLPQHPPPPSSDPILGTCRVRLDRIVWDSRIMCIAARLLDEGWQTTNKVAHVTVGTADQSIKPKESNELLEKWMALGGGAAGKEVDSDGIRELAVRGGNGMELEGEVKAVLQNLNQTSRR
ncbi:hypothetical protein MMC20_007742 [Loxospora ochrophaea]|nr:hypothetical protein [Loxospora ochrophaea]